MYSDFKGKAIEFVKLAVAEDEAGNLEKALGHYKAALDYFSTHLKYEKNARSREAITVKFKEYLARAEYLKQVGVWVGLGGNRRGGKGVQRLACVYACVCACERAWLSACVCACVRACVCVGARLC
jgi:vacuolar protein-sorting-associated protein 4